MHFLRSIRAKTATLFLLLPILILSACGSTSTTGTNGSTTTTKGLIVVASKLDVESQLIAEMYILLLQKAGYQVTPKLALGNSVITLQALKSGSIDIYPEFTATGLNALGIPSSFDPTKDYQAVKQGFEQQYHITWLDMSPLNDGYAICTTQQESQKLGATTLSQLAPQVSKLILATPSDGISFIDDLKTTYGFTTKSFKSLDQVLYAVGFKAVQSGQAQVNVCYTTDGTVAQQGFIFLQDDKHGFPEFHPAPIVRDSVLAKYPDIATVLNKLAPTLTTDVSIQLQNKVATDKSSMSVTEAVKMEATNFLKSQGLL